MLKKASFDKDWDHAVRYACLVLLQVQMLHQNKNLDTILQGQHCALKQSGEIQLAIQDYNHCYLLFPP